LRNHGWICFPKYVICSLVGVCVDQPFSLWSPKMVEQNCLQDESKMAFPSGLNFCHCFSLCRPANGRNQQPLSNLCFQLSLRKPIIGCLLAQVEICGSWLVKFLSSGCFLTISMALCAQSNQAKVDCNGWVKHRAHSSLLNWAHTASQNSP
jgi:hypothetical protein